MKNAATILKFLRPDKIQTVVNDLRLIQAGYRLYYAVDPHEIFNFCFPLRSADAEQRGTLEIDELAADQASLYEICFKYKEKPLLVGDYADELSGLMRYSTDVLAEAYDAAEVVDALIEKGGVDDIAEHRQGEDLAETVQIISQKFHIVLAVAMGIYSLGAERFRQVYRDLVTDGKGLPQNNDGLREYFNKYHETELSDRILQELMKKSTWLNEQEFRKKRRSAFFDAKAIDQLIQVNTAMLRDKAASPRLVLYLSSAQRTETAFEMKATQKRLPLLADRPFNFHRDRSHIFYRLAYRSDQGDLEETIQNLEKVKRSLEGLNKLNYASSFRADYCSQCVLDGGSPNHCEMAETCEHLKTLLEPIEQRNTEIRNLALTQTLSRYEELKRAKPEGTSQEKLMDFFCRVFEDQQLKDVATQKKLEKEKLIFLQSVTAKMWARSREFAVKEHLRAGRDSITGTVQYLPLNPKIESPQYREIVELVLSYYKTPPQGDEKKIEVIDKAYRLYLDKEAMTIDLNPQHELVRCLLYLTIPSTEGDKRAYEHALEMLRLPNVLRQTHDADAEFRYIACWAARRLRNFADANDQAAAAIAKWPDDPRFHHGLSLSKLAEWEAGPETADRVMLLMEAEEAALKAIEYYVRKPDETREFIGATYNNIAYVNTLRAKVAVHREMAQSCLVTARAAIQELKTYVPEEEWKPTHPNYFHTDALLYYFESINGIGDSPKERAELLRRAQQQINHALDCVAKPMYVELNRLIANAQNRLK